MAALALHPYVGYKVYRVLHRKTNRYMAVLVSPSHRTTIGYAKYILETTLGRKLNPGHQAHHKDENTLNDSPDNLEEKEKKAHMADHNAAGKRRYLLLICPKCKTEFLIEYRNTHWGKKSGTRTSCSRQCSSAKGGSPETIIKQQLWLTKEERARFASAVEGPSS